MTRFTPLRDRVVVERVPLEVRKGLIWLPETSQQKPQMGIILAVGDGYIDEKGECVPLRVRPGQKILFGKYTGTDIILDNKELVIMREEDVLGIVEDGDEPKGS